MNKLRVVLGLLLATNAFAQSVPNGTITQGQIWTTSQWNYAWQQKADVTNGVLTTPVINSETIAGFVAQIFGTPTAGHCAYWYSATQVGDAGSACGSGGGGTPGGSSGQIQYNNAGTFGGIATTGTGNAVLATSPTLVAPILGTPSSVTLTNATGLPSGTGLTTALTTFSSITGCSNSTVVGGTIPLGSVFFVGAGSFNAGASGTCAVTITLPTAIHGWQCSASDKTAQVLFTQTGSSTTTCLLSGAATSGDVIVFEVKGY